jgi:hypothetical protein
MGHGQPAHTDKPVKASHQARRISGPGGSLLAALAGPGHDKPVWHCAVRAASTDRVLSDLSGRSFGIVWYGGGKLAADLTLPKLRQRWDPSRSRGRDGSAPWYRDRRDGA